MIDFILHLKPAYAYPAIFFGHIFLGGLVLVPALYLSAMDNVSLPILFLLIVTSSMVTDSFWYTIGKYITKKRVYSFSFVKKRMEEAKNFSAFYDKYGVWAVFFTKFIYGTRIASHILAGMHRIGYLRFLFATALGTSVWFFVMFFIIKLLDRGISGTSSITFRIQAIFLATVVLILAFNWLTGKYVRKRLMNRKEK